MSFETWMKNVDNAVSEIAGLSVYDLPDANFRDAYNDEIRPQAMAKAVLSSAGWLDAND